MAIINLKDVTVTKVHRSGNGLEVAEEFTVAGQKRTRKFTVWFAEPTGLEIGDLVSVSGLYSDQVKDFTNDAGEVKHYVERSLNSPRIEANGKVGVGAIIDIGGRLDESAPF